MMVKRTGHLPGGMVKDWQGTVLPMSAIGSDFYRPYWLDGPRPEGEALAQAICAALQPHNGNSTRDGDKRRCAPAAA